MANVQDFDRVTAEAIENLVRIAQDQSDAHVGTASDARSTVRSTSQPVDDVFDPIGNRFGNLRIGNSAVIHGDCFKIAYRPRRIDNPHAPRNFA